MLNSREMTHRTQTLPWWLRVEGVKMPEIKNNGPVDSSVSESDLAKKVTDPTRSTDNKRFKEYPP
jgi:hypothetical protein